MKNEVCHLDQKYKKRKPKIAKGLNVFIIDAIAIIILII
jgi:hypothetical protein